MAGFLEKIKVKSAVDDHVKLDLSSNHITTANWMQLNVAWSKEMVPNEKLEIGMETFTRLEPMPVPTFGRGNINNRCFFVPFRTIFRGWNDFITDTDHAWSGESEAGLIPHTRIITNSELIGLIFGIEIAKLGLAEGQGAAVVTGRFGKISRGGFGGSEDLWLKDITNGEEFAVQFNGSGRQLYKILLSLGYNIVPNFGENDEAYSALPLLAFLKVYCDWYYPSMYIQDERFKVIESMLNADTIASLRPFGGYSADRLRNDRTAGAAEALAELNVLQEAIELCLTVNYESDYFVSAWDNPNTPNSGSFSDFNIYNIDDKSLSYGGGTDNAKVETAGSDDPYYRGTPMLNTSNSVTQYALTALRSLTDYMKRHQLVGARALDRYLARFGTVLAPEKLNRSIYIGAQKQSLQFGDVMSTADTETSALGNYAGKGISYDSGHFEVNSDNEYGIVIILSSIVPKVGYYQGVDRNVLHVGKLDYWTPEFDNLGTQAISVSELIVPQDGRKTLGSVNPNEYIFGFIPRYAEYKIGRDRLTGDYRLPSKNTGKDSWNLMRNVSSLEDKEVDEIKHNIAFVRGTDKGQYDRIFYNTDPESADKFNVIYNFGVTSHSPMKSLYDTYEFDSNGKNVIEDVNGVKVN